MILPCGNNDPAHNDESKTKDGTRSAGKALTSASRTSRHDYTKLIEVKAKNPVDLVKHVEKGFGFYHGGGTATADGSGSEGNGQIA